MTPAAGGVARIGDESALRAVLGRYVSAYATLNVDAAKAVWPSVDTKALGRAFSGLDSQALYFADCQLSVAIFTASAQCVGTAEYVPKVGNRSAHLENRQWKFEMRKAGEVWTISRVDVR